MRLRSIKALVWELFFSNKLEFLLTAVLIPFVAFTVHSLVPTYPWLEPIDLFLPMAMFVTFLFFLMVFSYSKFSSDTATRGFPKHILLLPLPTWIIALLPMAIAVPVMSLYSVLWLEFIVEPKIETPFVLVLCALLVAIPWLQTINWGMTKHPIKAMIVLLVVTFTAAACIINLYSVEYSQFMNPFISWVGLLVLSLAAIYLVYRSVDSVRKGDESQTGINYKEINYTRVSLVKPFKNKFSAQFWYEQRMFGWIMPMAGIMVAVIIVVLAIFIGDNKEIYSLIALSLGMFLYLSAICGYSFSAPQFGMQTSEMGSFWSVRPLSNFDIAYSRLTMGLSSIAVGLILLLILSSMVVWLLEVPILDGTQLLNIFRALSFVKLGLYGASLLCIYLVLCWLPYSFTLAFNLWGNTKLRKRLSVILILGISLMALVSVQIELRETMVHFIKGISLSILILPSVLLITFIAWLINIFKNVASFKQLVMPFKTIVALLLFPLISIWVSSFEILLKTILTLGVSNLALLSLLPFILAPIAVEKNRHR